MQIPDVIIIAGATATGKTALGVEVAHHLGTDVISCDSQLVYTGLNIGTAKPTEEEMAGIPHWGIDLVEPTVACSAALYQNTVLPLVIDRIQRKQSVIMVGGTGFYLRQLFEPRTLLNVPPNPELRQQLMEWAEIATTEQTPYPLHTRLAQHDALRASQLYPQDTQRLLRALEIVESTGQPVPQTKTPCAVEEALGYMPHVQWVGLFQEDVAARWQRIETRVDTMLQAGWLEEVEALAKQYGHEAHALQVAHGYPELLKVLAGQQTITQAKERITFQVRQYASRQKKWFNKVSGVQWFDVSEGLPSPATLLL
jgi:tRNA dimethylallyltransferase